MSDDGLGGFVRKLARGAQAARQVMGSDLLAQSEPVAIGKALAQPVIERRKRRADGNERWVLILPFGEGEVRIETSRAEYEALAREMVRFWNAQGQADAAGAAQLPPKSAQD